jgi:hypothetical protein
MPGVIQDSLVADYLATGVEYKITMYDGAGTYLTASEINGNDWYFTAETSIHPTGGRYSELRFEIQALLNSNYFSKQTASITVYR